MSTIEPWSTGSRSGGYSAGKGGAERGAHPGGAAVVGAPAFRDMYGNGAAIGKEHDYIVVQRWGTSRVEVAVVAAAVASALDPGSNYRPT